MPNRTHPDAYALGTNLLEAIGEGNTVVLGEDVIGPIRVPEGSQSCHRFPLIGTTGFAAGSQVQLTTDKAFSRLATGAKRSFSELVADVTQVRKQSRLFFLLTWTSSAAGVCLILVAIGLLISGHLNAGLISTVASTVSQTVTMLLFRKDRELRRALESYSAHLADYHRVLAMVDIAETITDPQSRDESKQTIIRTLLKAYASTSDTPTDDTGD